MSVLAGVERCVLLHEGGEARIYKVYSGSKAYAIKWDAEGSRIDARVMDCLSGEKFAGVYHVLETGEKAGRPYLVYDYVEGVPLAGTFSLPVPFAISVVRSLVQSLAGLEKRGIHHGDLNPSNVLLDRGGGPTLIDCGIVGPGALPYAAPERFQGRAADTKSDMYSLGLLLYRMVAGEDLLNCARYEDYAQAASQIESMEPTSRLYGKGVDVQALSALEPLWGATLRVNPDDRAEDFEELDELLEIAFDSICGGSVSWMIDFDVDMAESVSPADEMNIPVSWNFSGNWLYRHETGIWMMASPSLCNFVEKLKMSLNAWSLYPSLLSVVAFMPQYIVVLFVLLLEESITLFL